MWTTSQFWTRLFSGSSKEMIVMALLMLARVAAMSGLVARKRANRQHAVPHQLLPEINGAITAQIAQLPKWFYSIVTAFFLTTVPCASFGQAPRLDTPCDGDEIDWLVEPPDCDGDGTSDIRELCDCVVNPSPRCMDIDHNGRPDECDPWFWPIYCFEHRTELEYCDRCPNNPGCPGDCPDGPWCQDDDDNDGITNWCETHPADCVHCIGQTPECADCDNDNIPDFEQTEDGDGDCNGDHIPDSCQTQDSDNDGIPDICESGPCSSQPVCDCDGDGQPDPQSGPLDCTSDCDENDTPPMPPCADPPDDDENLCPNPCHIPVAGILPGNTDCDWVLDVTACEPEIPNISVYDGNPCGEHSEPALATNEAEEAADPGFDLGTPNPLLDEDCHKKWAYEPTGRLPGAFYVYYNDTSNGPPPPNGPCHCCYYFYQKWTVLCSSPIFDGAPQLPNLDNQCCLIVRARHCTPQPLVWRIKLIGESGELTDWMESPASLELDSGPVGNGQYYHFASICDFTGFGVQPELIREIVFQAADPRSRADEVFRWSTDYNCMAETSVSLPCTKPTPLEFEGPDDNGEVIANTRSCWPVRWEVLPFDGVSCPQPAPQATYTPFNWAAKIYPCPETQAEKIRVRAIDIRETDNPPDPACYREGLFWSCWFCNQGECTVGAGSARVGSVQFGVSLGKDTRGRSLPPLFISGDEPVAELATPSMLEFNGIVKDGYSGAEVRTFRETEGVRQVVTFEGVADVISIENPTTFEYEIRLYAREQMDFSATNGPYLPKPIGEDFEQPFIVWHVMNAGGTQEVFGQLHITKKVRIAGAFVDKLQFRYSYDSAGQKWDLHQYEKSGGSWQEVQQETSSWVGNVKQWRKTLGSIDIERVHSLYDSSHQKLLSTTVDPNSATEPLTTVLDYYPAEDANANRLRSILNPDGSWKWLIYDQYGRLQFECRPWLDGPTHATFAGNPLPATARSTEYVYPEPEPGQPADFKPQRIIERALDQFISMTDIYRPWSTRQIETRHCENGNEDPCGHLAITSDFLSAGDHRPLRTEGPDGTVSIYAYQAGCWGFPGDDYSVPPVPLGCAPGQANHLQVTRTTKIAGTEGDTEIEGRTTQSVEILDAAGRVFFSEERVYAAENDYPTLHWTTWQYDSRGRLLHTYRSDGTSTSTEWDDCCGEAASVDVDGSRTEYERDALSRIVEERRKGYGDAPDIVTSISYSVPSGGGRETERSRYPDPANSIAPIVTSSIVDVAGRLKSQVNEIGLTTTYTSSDGGRTTSVQMPGNKVEVTTRYLDGRIKSITGTGVILRYYEYGAENDTTWSKEYVGSSDNSSPRWTKTTFDSLGRKIKEERPAFDLGNATATVETISEYNDKGQLKRTLVQSGGSMVQAPVLYEYDSLGELSKTCLDLNNNEVIDDAGPDRIVKTEHEIVKDDNDDWWSEQRSFVYTDAAVDGRGIQRTRFIDAPVTTAEGKLTSQTQIEDAVNSTWDGVTITTSAYSNSAQKKVTQRTSYSGTANQSIQVVRNGLLESSTDKAGLTTLYFYDGLGRQSKVRDPRGLETMTTYDSFGRTATTMDTASQVTTYSYYAENAGSTQHQFGLLSVVTNPNGKTTRYEYDLYGRIIHVWGDVPQPVTIEYDSQFGDRIRLHTFQDNSVNWSNTTWPGSSATSSVTEWDYESRTGLLLRKRDDLGKTTEYAYRPEGRLLTREWSRLTTSSVPVKTTYGYDLLRQDGTFGGGELKNLTYNDGTPSITFSYDRAGRLKTALDSVGMREFEYAATGARLTEKFQSGSWFADQVLRTEFNDLIGEQTQFNVARLSKIDWRADGAAAADYGVDYDYDGNRDRMTTVTGTGLTDGGVEYRYRDEDTELVSPSGMLWKTEHKVGESPILTTERKYETQRNALDALTNNVQAYDSNPLRTISSYEYDHDNLARRRAVVHTGEAFTASESGNHSFRWKYNARNEVERSDHYAGTTIPADTAADSVDNKFVREYAYDPIGNRSTTGNYHFVESDDPNVPSAWHFSLTNYSKNSLNQYRMVKSSVPSSGQGLNYDDDGNLIEAYVASDLNDDGQVNITDLNLLLSAMGTSTCTDPAPINTKYFYRADVNDDCLISLDDLVALLGNFGLTSAHSMHAIYLWDAENRLSEVIPSAPSPSAKRVKFRYDYMSRRVEKLVYARNAGNSAWQSVPSDHRRWVYFGWLPILELKVSHAASGEETGTLIARKYTWGLDLSQSVGGAGGIGGLLATLDTLENTTASDDRTFAYFYDGNGNVTQLIETTGGTAGANFGTLAARYEYDPYGRPLLDDADTGVSGTYAATNTFRFSTKPVDAETSFSYFGYRYYSATMGRWINRDPLEEQSNYHVFSFGHNAPVNRLDPDGARDFPAISIPEIVEAASERAREAVLTAAADALAVGGVLVVTLNLPFIVATNDPAWDPHPQQPLPSPIPPPSRETLKPYEKGWTRERCDRLNDLYHEIEKNLSKEVTRLEQMKRQVMPHSQAAQCDVEYCLALLNAWLDASYGMDLRRLWNEKCFWQFNLPDASGNKRKPGQSGVQQWDSYNGHRTQLQQLFSRSERLHDKFLKNKCDRLLGTGWSFGGTDSTERFPGIAEFLKDIGLNFMTHQQLPPVSGPASPSAPREAIDDLIDLLPE